MPEIERFFEDERVCPQFFHHYDEFFRSFIETIHKNDEARLYELLSENNSTSQLINSRTCETVLHIACRFGSISLVRQIIELGVDVNAESENKETPLYHAIGRSAEMVQILLDNGADLTISDLYGISPLQQSFLAGSVETVFLLLNKIYSVELCSNQEEAPENNFEKCKKIVQICSDHNVNLNWREYPILLHFVAKYGDEETFKLVLNESKNIDIDALFPEAYGLIHVITNAGRANLLKIIIDYGADVDQIDRKEFSSLFYALYKNDFTCVRLLLDNGADVNLKNESGRTPVSYALRYCSNEIVKMILDAGVDIHKANVGLIPLHEACGFGTSLIRPLIYLYHHEYDGEDHYSRVKKWSGCSSYIINLLLEKGANVNAQYKYASDPVFTPLLIACSNGRMDIVQLLLKFGADLHERALLHAVEGNNIKLVSFLIGKGLNINASFMMLNRAIKCEEDISPFYMIFKMLDKNLRVDMIEFLADNGAILADSEMKNVMVKAICNRQPEEVVCLLELKPIVETPLNFAISYPRLSCFCDLEDVRSLRQLTAFSALNNKTEKILECTCGDDHYCDMLLSHDEYLQECKLETVKLKSKKISNKRNKTYFDFLNEELLDVVRFTSSEELMQNLESEDYKKEFPCYAFLLEQRVKRVEKLRTYVDSIEEFFHKKVGKWKMSRAVLCHIFSFLKVGDIRNWGRAVLITE